MDKIKFVRGFAAPNAIYDLEHFEVDADRVHIDAFCKPEELLNGTVGLWLVRGLHDTAVIITSEATDKAVLDVAADADLLGEFHVDPDDVRDADDTGQQTSRTTRGEVTECGSEGDFFDLSRCYVGRIRDLKLQPPETIVRVAFCVGACRDNCE